MLVTDLPELAEVALLEVLLELDDNTSGLTSLDGDTACLKVVDVASDL